MLPLKEAIVDFSTRIGEKNVPPLFKSLVAGCLQLDQSFRLTFGSIVYFCITEEQVIHRFDNVEDPWAETILAETDDNPGIISGKDISYNSSTEPILKYRRLQVRKGKWQDIDVSIKSIVFSSNNTAKSFTSSQREAANTYLKKVRACEMQNIVSFIGLVPESFEMIFEFASEGSLERYISKNPTVSWQQRIYFAYESKKQKISYRIV
jgi:serine/threonine protein kinase